MQLPEVGGTGETFHVASSLADDLAVIARSRREPPQTQPIPELQFDTWGDERRWRNRAQVMAEEFFNMLRPKYGSLLPDYLMKDQQQDVTQSFDDHHEVINDIEILISLSRNLTLPPNSYLPSNSTHFEILLFLLSLTLLSFSLFVCLSVCFLPNLVCPFFSSK